MYRDRELRAAELRRDYLAALADEHDEWRRAKEAMRPVKRAAREREQASAAAWRAERNAADDERTRVAWQVAEEREFLRAMDREAARNAAHAAYRDMKNVRLGGAGA